ncbi:MAG TPA: RNA polymerase sigma factor [bacterium]|nr:RNA polymerase sigma factor [bacterium]
MDEAPTLLEKLKAGDHEAFNDVIKEYHREIYFLTLRMVKKAEDAEDLTQQTFINAFEKIGSFRGDSSLKTWLYQIALNLCRTHLRKKRVVVELNENILNEGSYNDSPLGSILKTEQGELAKAELDKLSEKQKMAVILRVFHDMEYKQIGDIIHCSEKTAKVNFHYGIDKLRKKMKENGIM